MFDVVSFFTSVVVASFVDFHELRPNRETVFNDVSVVVASRARLFCLRSSETSASEAFEVITVIVVHELIA